MYLGNQSTTEERGEELKQVIQLCESYSQERKAIVSKLEVKLKEETAALTKTKASKQLHRLKLL